MNSTDATECEYPDTRTYCFSSRTVQVDEIFPIYDVRMWLEVDLQFELEREPELKRRQGGWNWEDGKHFIPTDGTFVLLFQLTSSSSTPFQIAFE